MDFDSALRSFAYYEKTFGKVLKSTMKNFLREKNICLFFRSIIVTKDRLYQLYMGRIEIEIISSGSESIDCFTVG